MLVGYSLHIQRASHSFNGDRSLGIYCRPYPTYVEIRSCNQKDLFWALKGFELCPRRGSQHLCTNSQVVGTQKHEGLVLPVWGMVYSGSRASGTKRSRK